MKHQKAQKKLIKGGHLHAGKGRRNYVRRSFSRKLISFAGQGTSKPPAAEIIGQIKPGAARPENPNAKYRNGLRLVPKSAAEQTNTNLSAAEESTVKADNHSTTSYAGSDGSSGNNNDNGSGSGGGNGSSFRWHSPRVTGLVAAVLLLAMLVTAAWSSVSSAKAGDDALEVRANGAQTGTMQLAKEYIYAGSRMLAIEDYGLSGSTPANPTPTPNGTNVALASNGGVASASSESHAFGYNFLIAYLNNGEHKGANWGSSPGGWLDDTPGNFPDWAQITFNGTKDINEIDVFTLQDNYQNPVEPTENLTFSQFGITAFDVQYWNGTAWTTVPNGSISGNNKVWRKLTFSPIATSAIRIQVNSAASDRSPIVEIEAYGTPSSSTVAPPPSNPTPTPTITPSPSPTVSPTPAAAQNVIWQNIQGTTISGSAVAHSGETYFGMARSQQTITSGYFEWTNTGYPDVWVGLGNNNDEVASQGEADFSYYMGGDIREMGVYKTDVPAVSGDIFRIEIAANGTVTYKKNGTVVYTSGTTASGSYYLVFKSQETTGHGIPSAMVSGSAGGTPTPTVTPTPTPTPAASQAIVFNGTSFGEVTLPNSAPFTSLGGFQIVWRVRGAANHQPDNLPGYIFNLSDIGVLANQKVDDPSRFDSLIPQRTGDSLPTLYMTPTDFSDSVCKLQYDPANSRWTFETWKADGTGYVSNTTTIQNASNFNFGGQTLDIGASNFQNRLIVGKLDYWRWIQRVEPLGTFPSATAPTGVTYLADYEFDGNGNDSSGNGLNLTLTNSPTFETTP